MGKPFNLTVIDREISELKPRKGNPRTHSKKQIRQIARSIEKFGFISTVLIDGDNAIIAGHGRLEAAKLLGMRSVPCVRVDHLSADEIRAYVIADNKLAENAGWDIGLLVENLKELEARDFDLTITGFETAKIDQLLGDIGDNDTADEIPKIDETKPAVTRLGDLWRIGKHFLFCGDSTEPESYVRLLGDERAQMVFTDPPYNVPIDGHVCGLGKVKHRDFEMASGEMTEAEFAAFLETVFRNLADNSVDGALHYVCMDWRHIGEVLTASKKVYSKYENLCVWNKSNGGMGSFYRSKHELVFLFKKGDAPHINNVELGKHGRYRTNVWDYAGINTFGKERDKLAMHPTVKPVALVADAIKDASQRNGVVLGAFAGSGTTLIAAEQTGRRGYGIEMAPHYVDITIKRFAAAFGIETVLAKSGETFDAVRRWRASGVD